jgi:1,4-dihydroxy-2-naphthoyl-CoA synthase
MCGPAISLVLGATAAMAGAVGQYQQAQGTAAQYARDAKIARQQATFDAQRQQRDIRRQLAALHASTASAGIQSGSGSPLDIAADLTAEAELEPFEQIRRGLIQYQDLKLNAKRTRSAAGVALLGDSLRIGGSLIGAVTSE